MISGKVTRQIGDARAPVLSKETKEAASDVRTIGKLPPPSKEDGNAKESDK